jgi:hypothetical protein
MTPPGPEAMPATTPGAEGAVHHAGFLTTCGREIRVGHLTLGGGRHPAQRVSLGISAASAAENDTWAGFTPGEARRLAAALLVQAAACDRGHQ